MSSFNQLLTKLSDREISRKQFLLLVGGTFLGMSTVFQLLQNAHTPDLATSDKQVFGEREYGHVGTADADTHKVKSFDEDIFG